MAVIAKKIAFERRGFVQSILIQWVFCFVVLNGSYLIVLARCLVKCLAEYVVFLCVRACLCVWIVFGELAFLAQHTQVLHQEQCCYFLGSSLAVHHYSSSAFHLILGVLSFSRLAGVPSLVMIVGLILFWSLVLFRFWNNRIRLWPSPSLGCNRLGFLFFCIFRPIA